MAGVSLASLSLLNFLIAQMQTGFGAFVSVHLIAHGWDTGQIGLVLSAGTIAAIVSQVPAGMAVDGSSAKRNIAAAAIVLVMAALLVLEVAPGFWPVLGAEVVGGVAGPALSLAIAAITLALARQEDLGERLGQNARFAAIGAAIGAGVLGFVGTTFSPAAVFAVAAAFGAPALWVLFRIRRQDLLTAHRRTDHLAAPPPARRRAPPARKRWVLHDRRLLAFLACCVGFHLTNTAMLPLAAAEAARSLGGFADGITAAATVVPQILVAAISPWVGRLANRRGRRFVLLLGYLALPARALLFALVRSPDLIVVWQVLDGVSAAVFGVMLPLVVADITRRGGRFNFVLGVVGVADALGAAASNAAAGTIADAIGLRATFMLLAMLGAGAWALVWLIMPETAPLPHAKHTPHVAVTVR